MTSGSRDKGIRKSEVLALGKDLIPFCNILVNAFNAKSIKSIENYIDHSITELIL